MKKLLIAAVMSFGVSLAWAGDVRNTPVGPNQALASADYGGVYISTLSFSSAAKLAFRGPGVFQGVVMSTGATTDFVVLRDSNTANTSSQEFLRVYNIATTTTPGNVVYSPPFPIRVKNGLSFNYNQATLNILGILYTPDPK